MKRAKKSHQKPRNPEALNPLLKKGGSHARQDKKASRAKQMAQVLQLRRRETEA